jgi:hypothetical protein
MSKSDGLEDVAMPGPDEVPRRLAELSPDLTLELLAEAVFQGQTAGNFCTASHPVTCTGTMAYLQTNGALRESLAARGWERNDEDNISRIISPDMTITITAVSGDENTGLVDKSASTRRPRGSAGLRIVRRNSQLELLPEDAEPNAETITAIQPTWYLLYLRDQDEVRSELSLARSVGPKGKLQWFERLILPAINLLDGPPSGGESVDAPDVDVPVTRRTG